MRHVYVLFQFENVELFTFLFLFNKWKCDEFERFSFTMAIIFVLHEKLFRRIVRCAKKWKFVMNLAWKPNCKKCSWKKLNKWKDFTFDAEREPFVPIKWHHDIHFFFKKKNSGIIVHGLNGKQFFCVIVQTYQVAMFQHAFFFILIANKKSRSRKTEENSYKEKLYGTNWLCIVGERFNDKLILSLILKIYNLNYIA